MLAPHPLSRSALWIATSPPTVTGLTRWRVRFAPGVLQEQLQIGIPRMCAECGEVIMPRWDHPGLICGCAGLIWEWDGVTFKRTEAKG